MTHADKLNLPESTSHKRKCTLWCFSNLIVKIAKSLELSSILVKRMLTVIYFLFVNFSKYTGFLLLLLIGIQILNT